MIPRQEQIIRHKGYTVSYNKDLKIPNWVSYELTRQETKGKEKRGDNFIADPLVKGAIATNADYARSGYDKGHMAPAADMKWSPDVMKESFYFSNMCPQHPQLNRRGWKNLEEKIRDWAVADSAIIIICGPIIDKPSKTIGKNKVAVPERFFKVILSPFVKPARGIGFLFNNRQAVEPLSTYAVSIDSIEKLTHMDFFSPLPDEIENAVTKKTYACFEPTLDYVVVKIPRLPFDKFISAKRTLTTQMKATGEVMSICTNFEGGLMKAIRSLSQHVDCLETGDYDNMSDEEVLEHLSVVDDRRIYLIAEILRRGIASYDEIHEVTKIDKWFIDKLAILVEMEKKIKESKGNLDKELLKEAKRLEFPDNVIARWTGKTEEEIKNLRYEYGITAAFKMVDTCAAEFASETPYYYSCFDGMNEVEDKTEKKKIMVLGSGPIRIGQGIEFDYCSVHSVWALKQEGYETIIVNNNPETVSTDFDIADKLYFEPLTPEDVENIVRLEKPDGAVVQFGGQTAINLTESLMKMGVKILGTSAEDVDAAEDRELFDQILEECKIPRAKGDTVFTTEEALKVANELGYPVLIRPSYVLGGQGMQIAVSDDDIKKFMQIVTRYHQEHPILIDKYLMGKEIEVDAVCDGEDILIPGIMEHIERAGIHSGDSISVYPAQTITERIQDMLVDYTRKLAKSLHVIGLINIQFIVYHDQVYVIEVNPRSSRTVPYISKVTGIPIVDLATKVILGAKVKDFGYGTGLAKKSKYIAIKMPVFSFEKLRGAEISLGPEMKSTGECLGISKDFNEALYKAFKGAGVDLPKHKKMIITLNDADKEEGIEIAKRFKKLGYDIFSTRGTAKVFNEAGVLAIPVNRINEEAPTLMDLLLEHQIDLVIDTPTHDDKLKDGFIIRRTAIETGVNCLTSLDTAAALLTSLETEGKDKLSIVDVATISEQHEV